MSNSCVTRDSSSLLISESLGLFGLSNQCVTRDSSSLMFYESLGALWAVESMRHPWQQLVDDFWVPRGCLDYRNHASLVAAVRWLFLSPYEMFWLSNPCVTRDSSSLMISESLGAVWAVESMRHPWQQFVDDLCVPTGCLDCRIHGSPVTTVRWWFLSPYEMFGLSSPGVTLDSNSLMISKFLGAIWAVESMGHPWQQFVDDFWVPRAVCVFENMRHPWQQFVAHFWVPRGCLSCRIYTSPLTAVRWWFMCTYGLFRLSNPWITRDSSSLMISESFGDVGVVESMGHPCDEFVDDFWVHRGWLVSRIHASPVTAGRCWFLSP